MENLFDELKRYVHFDLADEAALIGFAPEAEPHFRAIAEAFYARIEAHPAARDVFTGPEQVARLKGSLCDWMGRFLRGPWSADYYTQRLCIGRMHVAVGLPQRYMFGAMNVLRGELQRIAGATPARAPLARALDKLLDIELAIMLESYSQAHLEQVQRSERLERDRLLQDLALSEARYDEIVERAEALITTLDSDGRILFVNSKVEQLTGAQRASMKGARWLELFVREGDREGVQALQQRALDERTAQVYEGPLRTERSDHTLRWLFTRLPQSSALCAIGIDVTHEHELSVRARRAERLASLGTMAAGFAHEIRNPLNAAKLQLSVARRRLHGPAASPAVAEGALDAAELELQRLAVLVDDFLVFARPQPLRLVQADLRSLAGEVLAFLAPEAQAASVAVQLVPGEPLQLELDTGLIKQVLVNLLRNAVEASQPGGRVRVVVERAGPAARVVVEDEGTGFGANAPIFEPFYTTKDRGAGLGLAIAHRIVMDHAGSVEAKSQPGRTVFAVMLPLARPASLTSNPAKTP